MKTTRSIKKLLVTILIVSSLFSQAQNPFLSLQITRSLSGSGLGGNVCPNLALTFKRHTLAVGPNFQRREMNFSGIQSTYKYCAAKSTNKKLELFFSCSFIFHQAAYMSKGNIEIEKSCKNKGGNYYEDLKLKVFECYGSIGLKISPVRNLNISLSSGIGMYDTFCKKYDTDMYRQKSALVMQMRATLSYDLKFKTSDEKKEIHDHIQRTKL